MHSIRSFFRPNRIRLWIYPKTNIWQSLLYWIYSKSSIWQSLLLLPKNFRVNFLVSILLATIISHHSTTDIWQVVFLAVLVVCIYMFIWYIYTRPRHIIQQFNYPEDLPELRTFANKATDIFLETLRNIDTLLSLRQVENASNEPDNPLAVVVTSGETQERIQELTSSVNVNASGINFSLDKLLAFVIFYLAKTRIRGLIQKRQDGELEISIEIIKRNGSNLYASRVINRDNSTGFIKDIELVEKIKELAVEIVMRLEQRNLPSSWESLRNFLGGLEASSQRNWWHSVALYRNVIQKEEAFRGEFGLGHHHLGSILVSQGEPDRGLEHLKIAEASGFPLVDTYYMIALTLFYIYQNDLHQAVTDSGQNSSKNRNNRTMPDATASQPGKASLLWIDQIEIYCERALSLKKDFPEAYHLLGTAHYQAGKLLERVRNSKKFQISVSHYKIATKNLRTARKQYIKRINGLQVENRVQAIKLERERLLKNYITATHRLAAASRSLKKIYKAEDYYKEILEVVPANMQTLVDLAKTYCLAKRWSDLDELFKKEIASIDGATWNVDINFYRGWAIAGSLAKSKTPNNSPTNKLPKNNVLNQLRKAFQFLDYALYQRPRFISSWRQTDWRKPFQNIAAQLSIEETNFSFSQLTQNTIPDNWVNSILLIDLWLWWRIDSYDDKDANDKPESRRNNETSPLLGRPVDPNRYPFPKLDKSYLELKLLRKRTKKLLKIVDQFGYVGGVTNHWIRINWAQLAYKTWKEACIHLQKKNFEATFGYRWAIDVYAEIALLACRLLAECHMYENLFIIAHKTNELLCAWLVFWSEKNNKNEDIRFSAKVLGHQIATCYAWKVYAILQLKNDPETHTRIENQIYLPESDEKVDINLINVQEELDNAFKHRPFHPLAIYVQAQFFRQKHLHRLAIDKLTFLLSLVEPFDPKTFFINNNLYLKYHASAESTSERLYYYYMERVSGQQQFEDFIDRTRIHMELAELFTLENDIKSSVEHYLMALTWSPYQDMDAKNLLRLTNQLYRLSRFDEAFSVIQEIYVRQQYMLPSSSAIKGREAEIMECILRTRLDNYHSALEKGLSLSKALPTLTFRELTNIFSHLDDVNIFEHFKDTGYKDDDEEMEILTNHKNKKMVLTLTTCFDDATKLVDGGRTTLNNIYNGFRAIARNEFSIPDQKLLRACLLLNTNKMKGLLKKKLFAKQKFAITDENEKYKSMTGHLVFFLCKKSLTILIQEAELANNIAYNQAELRIDLDKAKQRSLYSIKIFEFIADCISNPGNIRYNKFKNNDPKVVKRIKILKSKENFTTKYGNVISGQQILEKLALYHDTLGWLYYRKNEYVKAVEQLERALQYSTYVMPVHYHLARVLLSQYEQLWQSPNNTDKLANIENGAAGNYLRQAFYHVNMAQELDTVQRFESKVFVLKKRIQNYRKSWDDVHLDYGKNYLTQFKKFQAGEYNYKTNER